MSKGIKFILLFIYCWSSCWNIENCFAKTGDYFYESTIDNDSCSNCPEYLKLLADVHKVVGSTPTNTSISNDNNIITEVSNLRFLYYETRSTLENGRLDCQILQNQDPKNPSGLKRDSLRLLSEKVLENQAIRNLQLYPHNTEEEARYFYRGKGIQENLVVEVIVKKDFSAVVRYHYYDEKRDPISSSTQITNGRPYPKDEPVTLTQQPSLAIDNPSVEKIPTSQVLPGVYLDRQVNIQRNNQVFDTKVSNSSGETQLNATTIHDGVKGQIDLTTSIPIRYKLTSTDEGLAINGTATTNNSLNYRPEENTEEKNHNESLALALTNKGRDYLTFEGTSDENSIRKFSVQGRSSPSKTGSVGFRYADDGKGGQRTQVNGTRVINDNLSVRAGLLRDQNDVDTRTFGARVSNKDGDFLDVSTLTDENNFRRSDISAGQGVRENSNSETKINRNPDGSTSTQSVTSNEKTNINAEFMQDSNNARNTTLGFNTKYDRTSNVSNGGSQADRIASTQTTDKVNLSGSVNRVRAATSETETVGGKLVISREQQVVSPGDKVEVYSAGATIDASVRKTSEDAKNTKVRTSVELGDKITLRADYNSNDKGGINNQRDLNIQAEMGVDRDTKVTSELTRNSKGLDTVAFGGSTNIHAVGRVGMDYSGQFSEESERSRKIAAHYSVNVNQTDYNATLSHDTVAGTAFQLQAERRISDYISMSVSVETSREDRVFLYQMSLKH